MRTIDVMTRDVVAVRPDTPLKEVAQLLVEHGIGGVPVVADDGAVVGVVSESDFLIKERGEAYVRQSRLARLFGHADPDAAKLTARTAGEAMTSPAVTIDSAIASVREAAIVMAERGVNRLPVTDGGRLVGIITRGDIVRIFARSDQEIAQRVRRALHGVDTLLVESVRDGVVTLAGTLPSRALATRVAEIARAVDGVVAVDTERLTWTEDREPTGSILV